MSDKDDKKPTKTKDQPKDDTKAVTVIETANIKIVRVDS